MKKFLVIILFINLGLYAQAQRKTVVVNHMAFDVTDLKRSFIFYKQIIGLDSINDPFHDQKHRWLRIAEHAQLHLIEVKNETAIHFKGTHICFSVPSIEDVVLRLKENQVPFENWLGVKNTFTLRPDGVKQIYFQDPDGYWIEINNDPF